MGISMENGLSTNKSVGKQSVLFQNPPCVLGYSSIAGKKEGEGPLGSCFDIIEEDPLAGGKSWEDAESRLQKKAAELAIQKASLQPKDIRYLIAGDLLGQLIATSFGIVDLEIPMFGVYGACSTMGESISIAAMLIDGGFADKVIALTSSHFAGAEKQFRFPLDYGNQRPLAATWTVTGSGAVILGSPKEVKKLPEDTNPTIHITGITTGKVMDYGIKDSMNMGACMAPAAADVIFHNLSDFDRKPDYYDKIITGDLGYVGADILKDIMKEKGYDISKNHMDCGVEIFSKETQDTHSGGSGCGCSAITLTGYVFKKMIQREWKKVLFVPTGALLSTVSFNEGNSVPGIAHGVVIEIME
ncbi:stage V sporulation protein AD [Anaeromicropila herbilytica]|uniref:Stage V sporulation protein AD n=1 Tax=Anaeromicropila herbilytica TaxID=2785025 RepID=A0A7R7IBV5_9FIRM|nr:stage V sporulation protein AD [Anaeromicropila herbilytica]BCN30033.1 stage V sporulation protein AD [Anaeromicropila herbilytica]